MLVVVAAELITVELLVQAVLVAVALALLGRLLAFLLRQQPERPILAVAVAALEAILLAEFLEQMVVLAL
jgi:hypothetical protein